MQLPLIFHSDALALSVSFVCSDLHVIFAFGPTKEAAEKIIVVEGYGLWAVHPVGQPIGLSASRAVLSMKTLRSVARAHCFRFLNVRAEARTLHSS